MHATECSVDSEHYYEVDAVENFVDYPGQHRNDKRIIHSAPPSAMKKYPEDVFFLLTS